MGPADWFRALAMNNSTSVPPASRITPSIARSKNPAYYDTRFVLFATAVTALGGFLFGYDTAVINGANTYLQAHFSLDPEKDSLLIGLATASAIVGCIPGAMSFALSTG